MRMSVDGDNEKGRPGIDVDERSRRGWRTVVIVYICVFDGILPHARLTSIA